MTMVRKWIRRWHEPVLALIVLGGLVRAVFFFLANDHLPQPFFYEPFDTWMDWFNTSYWAHHQGAYDAWGTVYPPLSFVFLRIFSKSSCYIDADGYSARQCDWVGLASLHGLFLLNVLLLFLSFRKIDRTTAPWRALALGFSLSTLFGLERGNLIVPCFTCVILGFGPLLTSARARWAAVGMAINFKVYIIASLVPQLLRRRWRWFEGAIIATVAVYVITYGVMGEGAPSEILYNISNFAGLYQAITFLDLWYATTYIPLISLAEGQYTSMSYLVGTQTIDIVLVVVPAIIHVVQTMVVAAAVAGWLRPEVVSMHRLTLLGTAMAMISSEPGGYTQCILIFFVFMERSQGVGRIWSIVISYVLCMPFDIILDRVPPLVQESYLAGHQTFFTYYVTLGPFLRPLFILSIAFALSCVTLRTVWRDIQEQGWKRRWRFRHDAPIMVGDGRIAPPGRSAP